MMTEVFVTDIRDQGQAGRITGLLAHKFPECKINMDQEETATPFPCGHSILRVEGTAIDAESIIALVRSSGFACAVLEDKICK